MRPESLDVIEMILNAGLVVQFVMLLLLLFSVTSWAIILIKYLFIRKAFKESALFVDYFWKSRNFSDAFTRSKQLAASPIARVFRIGYMELKKLSRSSMPQSGPSDAPSDTQSGETPSLRTRVSGFDNVKRALRRATNTEITKLMQMVPFLATAGNTAPFIGLFGTVWGIMKSFNDIGKMGSASLAVVAPGISEALIATAIGLAVAIPAVIAFNYFTQKIRVIESELQSFSIDFLNIVERDILSSKESG